MDKNNDIGEIKLEMIDLNSDVGDQRRTRKIVRSAEKKLRKVFLDRLSGKFGDC
jgi:hypothetical protein